MKRTLDVLISPTTRCNLRCKYCYVEQDAPRDVADFKIGDVGRAYKWLRQYGKLVEADLIRFTWFGGEPLLRGVPFLREAIALQNESLKGEFEVINTMQSNLTIVSDDLIPLLKEHFHGGIGGSLDFAGASRVFPNGESVQQTIERNVLRLREAGINVGLVCTLTKHNTSDPSALYSYYKALGTPFRVNRAAGASVDPADRLSVAEYGDFVKRLFAIYASDPNPTVDFSNFSMMVKLYLAGRPIVCVNTAEPYLFIGIEANGRIMSRCRFVGTVGNYLTETPTAVYDKFNRFSAERRVPQKCLSCEFYSKVCLGGCMGEPEIDCFSSDCGYRTEATYDLWCYIRDYLAKHGHGYAELSGVV